MTINKNILVISGPTATGKTSLSIDLAKQFNGEIINFDSLLFYKELSIGSAKPTIEEQSGVPHHLINFQSIAAPLNAAKYIELAMPIIHDCHTRGILPILVGGSGFYLQALLNGMYESPTAPQSVITKSNELYGSEGIRPFINFLKNNDYASFERCHQNDHYRIRRAVEHFWTTNSPFSKARESMKNKQETPIVKFKWRIFHAYLDTPKEKHWEIIQKRSSKMWKNGLEKEVQSILSKGFTGEEKPLQSIGYKETIDYIKGNFKSFDDFMERLNINTRRLAKSQRTWFNKQKTNDYHTLESRSQVSSDFKNFIGI